MFSMLRYLAPVAMAFLLMGAAPPPLIDLTGAWIRLHADVKDQPADVQVARFKRDLAPLAPRFYDPARSGIPPEYYDRKVVEALKRFPEIESAFVVRAAAVARQLADAQADFRRNFPDMGAMPPTYLLHSLGEMDGGTRQLGGKTALVFGADLIARVHAADANERPFFQHELFHVYHEAIMKDCDAMWCSLWEEGLATYVAAKLNPGAKPGELLLDGATLDRIKADAAAACAVRKLAFSTQDEDYRRLFNGGANLPGQPDRLGYYVGYLVVQKVGEGRSLRELAAMPVPVARQYVTAALADLAPDCTTGQS